MTIYFLSAVPPAASLRAALNEHSLFVCWRWGVWQAFSDLGLTAIFLDSAIENADRRRIDTQSLAIAQGWYRFAEEDLSLSEGISIGNLLEYEARQPVSFTLKWIAGIRSILSRYPDAKVEHDLGESVLGRLLESALPPDCRPIRRPQANLQHEGVDFHLYSTYALAAGAPRGLTTGTRRLLWRAASLLGRIRSFSSGRQVILWHSNQHLDAVLVHWLNQGSVDFVVALSHEMNPGWRLWPRLAASGRAAFLPPLPAAIPDRRLKARMLASWERAAKDPDYRRLFTWDGVEFAGTVFPFLDRLARHDIPHLSSACSARRKQFEDLRPSLVVATDDVTPNCRLAIRLAAACGVPSLVVQHGMSTPGWNQDFRLADFVAFWDDKTRSEFVRATGRDERTAFVVGIPDSIRRPPAPSATQRRRRSVLVLTTNSAMSSGFNGFVDAERFAVEVAEAVQASGVDCNVTFKIHPRESEAAYSAILSRFPERSFSIERTHPLGELFGRADAIVAAHTSAALEALPWGKPLIGFDALRNGVPWPLKEYYGLPVLSDTKALARWIREQLAAPSAADIAAPLRPGPSATAEILSLVTRLLHEPHPRP